MRDWRGDVPTSESLGTLRDHQEQLFKRARDLASRHVTEKFTVAHVTPGGGKTLAASIFAHVLLRAGMVDRVVVVVPRDSLREQMREGFHCPDRGLGLQIAAASSDVSARVIFDRAGYVTTYQAVAQRCGARHLKAVANCRTLVILDEVHHLVDEEGRGWVPGVRALVDHATHVLALSGNLARADEKAIPFIPYDDARAPVKHVTYSRMQALAEHAIIPLSTELLDGDTEYFHKGREHEVTLSTASAKQERKAIRTALALDEYRDRLVTMGVAAWLDYRDAYYRSQLIVVCDKQQDARNVTRQLRAAHPTYDVALAISDEKDAHRWLKKFRTRSGADILVTCQMAYEGLDAPWATHMIYLSTIRSLPWLEQATARLTRFNPACGLPWEKQAAIVFAPNDASMRAFVAQLNAEQDDRHREQAERHGSPRMFRRGDFQPIDATPTSVVVGGEKGIPSPEVQAKIREMRERMPFLQQLPTDDMVILALEQLGLSKEGEAAE